MLTNLKQKKNKFHCNIYIPHPELTLAFSGSLKIGLSCPCRYLKCLTNTPPRLSKYELKSLKRENGVGTLLC